MNPNDRRDPDGNLESTFREQVRDALGVDQFTRDFEIIERIKWLRAFKEVSDNTRPLTRTKAS